LAQIAAAGATPIMAAASVAKTCKQRTKTCGWLSCGKLDLWSDFKLWDEQLFGVDNR
jgi:hypothetical protein